MLTKKNPGQKASRKAHAQHHQRRPAAPSASDQMPTWADHSGWETAGQLGVNGGTAFHSTGMRALNDHADFEERDPRCGDSGAAGLRAFADEQASSGRKGAPSRMCYSGPDKLSMTTPLSCLYSDSRCGTRSRIVIVPQDNDDPVPAQSENLQCRSVRDRFIPGRELAQADRAATKVTRIIRKRANSLKPRKGSRESGDDSPNQP